MLSILVAITIAYSMWGASPLTAQNDCKVLKKVAADALNKVHNTPTHVYTTTRINGQSFSSEIIYAAGSMYAKANGKWISAGSIKDVEQSDQELQHDANSKDTCRLLKEESVNGEAASVYSSHSETPKGTIDLELWISKANGRLLRQDMSSNGALISSRYDYSNVKAPL
jgi:stringent starvation protein B